MRVSLFLLSIMVVGLTIMVAGPVGADSRWDHDGSITRLEASGNDRKMIYEEPGSNLPVKPGVILFKGVRDRFTYRGTAYKFSKGCDPIAYSVTGVVAPDDQEITLRGRAPQRNAQCKVVGYDEEELVFRLKLESNQETGVAPADDAPKDSTEIEQAVKLLAASFACPIKPIVVKNYEGPNQTGIMVSYNSRVITQTFLGDASQLKYSRTQHDTQKSDPSYSSIVGSSEDTYVHQGKVAFKDLQGGSRHGSEALPLRAFGKSWVLLKCSGGRACSSVSHQGKVSKHPDLDLMFCDPGTAKNALLAVNTLMRASK